jgi:hypothetical protein
MFVDTAFPGLVIKEDTVTVKELHQTFSIEDVPHVRSLEFVSRHARGLGQPRDLVFVHPNVARSSSTTITALGAGEPQSGLIPRLI